MQDFQITSKIHPKQRVKIITKDNGEYSAELYEGIVAEVLTETPEHYRGVKVRLTDGTIGRVREIIKKEKKKG